VAWRTRCATTPTPWNTPRSACTDSIYRSTQGTPGIPALHAARPRLKLLAEAGLDNIREKSKRQTALLMADRHRWRVNTPRDPGRRGGAVSIDMPHAERVCNELLKRDALVDFRPKAGVRFSPTFTTPTSCELPSRSCASLIRRHPRRSPLGAK
jgi:kynureninase